MRRREILSKIFGIALVFVMIGSMLGGLPGVASAESMEEFGATAYYCVYEPEMDGTQTVTQIISGTSYTLKASFLFGGHGVAMQGTGRTGADGDYIHYDGGGGSFAHIDNAQEFTDEVRQRYSGLGITDFAGFGNLALTHPEQATYSVVSGVIGASGRTLVPWYSVAVDPDVLSLTTTGTLIFKSGTLPNGITYMSFRADDTGGAIIGKRIDIYVGEGKSARDEWDQTGGSRDVEVYLKPLYGQGGSWPWAGDQLGTCDDEDGTITTIAEAGCAVTSIAMVFKYYGVQTDPGELNRWLTNHEGYSNGCEIHSWSKVAGRSLRVAYWGPIYNEERLPDKDPKVKPEKLLERIRAELDEGYPVIASVRYKGKTHFVVITGYSRNGTYYINDPIGNGARTTINEKYGDPASAIYSIRGYHGPKVNVLKPTRSSPAFAGPYDKPNHISVEVEVKTDGIAVPGLTKNDFKVMVRKTMST